MKQKSILVIIILILLVTLSCNLPVAAGTEKMKKVHLTTTGTRVAYSGDYSCQGQDKVDIYIDENGIVSIITRGPRYVDYINCEQDPDFPEDTFTIDGIADPDIQEMTLTSCNSGGLNGDGRVSYKDDKPEGMITCLWTKGVDANKVAMRLYIPSMGD